MKNKIGLLWQIFFTFFKIGAFTFGGGYAMVPLIQREASEKHGWVTDEDILDIVAIAESTPGPIAINSATFVGYRACGVLGSVAATLGVVLPSFMIILAISGILRQFQENVYVQYAFRGIRCGVPDPEGHVGHVQEVQEECARLHCHGGGLCAGGFCEAACAVGHRRLCGFRHCDLLRHGKGG